MVDMQRSSHSAKIDTQRWCWNDSNLLRENVLVEMMNRALEDTLSEYPPDVHLPIKYSPDSDGHQGPAVKDPATIFLCLPFDEANEGECVWTISLVDLVKDMLNWDEPDDEPWELEPGSPGHQLACRFREIADMIERGPRANNSSFS